jgi:hypothetical protein
MTKAVDRVDRDPRRLAARTLVERLHAEEYKGEDGARGPVLDYLEATDAVLAFLDTFQRGVVMPRKKILGPATTGQVLDYFQTADTGDVKLMLDVVAAVVAKRLPAAAPKPINKKKPAPKPPATYGETLSEA